MRTLVVLVLLLVAAPAHAQTAQAEDLYQRGIEAADKGDYPAACKLFARSLELDPAPATRLQLADCYERTGKTASAWDLYVQVRDGGTRDADMLEIARDGASRTEARVPKLLVKSAHAGEVRVEVDGVAWSLDVPLVIDPGKHRVQASADGFQGWAGEVEVNEGQTAEIEVPALAAGASVTPEAPAVRRERRTLAWIGLGAATAGVVVLGVGTWAVLDAKSLGEDADVAGCDADLENCTSPQALALAHDAYDRANLATGLFVAGGVLTAAGLATYVFLPRRDVAGSDVAWRLGGGAHGDTVSLTAWRRF